MESPIKLIKKNISFIFYDLIIKILLFYLVNLMYQSLFLYSFGIKEITVIILIMILNSIITQEISKSISKKIKDNFYVNFLSNLIAMLILAIFTDVYTKIILMLSLIINSYKIFYEPNNFSDVYNLSFTKFLIINLILVIFNVFISLISSYFLSLYTFIKVKVKKLFAKVNKNYYLPSTVIFCLLFYNFHEYYLLLKEIKRKEVFVNNFLNNSEAKYKEYLVLKKHNVYLTMFFYGYEDINYIEESINSYNLEIDYLDSMKKTDFINLCNSFNIRTKKYLEQNNLELKGQTLIKKDNKRITNTLTKQDKHIKTLRERHFEKLGIKDPYYKAIFKAIEDEKNNYISRLDNPCDFLKEEIIDNKKEIMGYLIYSNKEIIKLSRTKN